MPIKAQFDTVTVNNKDGAVVYVKFVMEDGHRSEVIDTISMSYTDDKEAEIRAIIEKKLIELRARYEISGNIQERMSTLCAAATENVAMVPIAIKETK